jgi:hypothetical protein
MVIKKLSATLLLSILGVGASEASVSFVSQAEIGFSVTNVVNSVSASGSFKPADSNTNWVYALDNEANPLDSSQYEVIANNPVVSLSLGSTHTFAVSGFANSGSVETHHVGYYQFDFTNSSESSETLQLNLNYDFLSSTSGSFVNNSFKLDFWQQGAEPGQSIALGYAELSAGLLFAQSYSDAVLLSNDLKSMIYGLNLSAGAKQSIYADLTVTNNLAPVPLPASMWFFVTGVMGLFGLKKRFRLAV